MIINVLTNAVSPPNTIMVTDEYERQTAGIPFVL